MVNLVIDSFYLTLKEEKYKKVFCEKTNWNHVLDIGFLFRLILKDFNVNNKVSNPSWKSLVAEKSGQVFRDRGKQSDIILIKSYEEYAAEIPSKV